MKKAAWWDLTAESTEAGDLKLAMRKLWQDHVMFTREVLISAIAKLDTSAILERLLRNQDEIGNAIAKYYGASAGATLANLLKEHIMVADEVLQAAIANSASLSTIQAKWQKNADAIAKFLSDANPLWPLSVLQDMLYDHLKLTTIEAIARLKKDWKSDLEAYDKNRDCMLAFADMLTDGIVKQKKLQ